MRARGSHEWWIETTAIAAGGIALAIWLWDGPLFASGPAATVSDIPVAETLETGPRSLGDLLEAGCITGNHLEAMRDGREVMVLCPPAGPRPFP